MNDFTSLPVEEQKFGPGRANQEILYQEIVKKRASRGPNCRGAEKAWFKKLNEKCRRCVRPCKQSAKAKIIRCPQYEQKA